MTKLTLNLFVFAIFSTLMVSAPLVSTFLASTAMAQAPSSNSPRSPSSAATRTQKTLTKAEALSRLRTLQSRLTQDLQNMDNAVKKRLQESTTMNLRTSDPKLIDRRIQQLGNNINDLVQRRNETAARRDFISSVIFLIDSKWTGQPLHTFLEHQLLDMAVSDMSDTHGGARMWKFMTYLSITIRETADPREDALNILEGFMNFASILEPRSPAEFISSRSYTSGSQSYTAKPMSRDRLGDEAEKRIKELKSAMTGQPLTQAQAIEPKTKKVSGADSPASDQDFVSDKGSDNNQPAGDWIESELDLEPRGI